MDTDKSGFIYSLETINLAELGFLIYHYDPTLIKGIPLSLKMFSFFSLIATQLLWSEQIFKQIRPGFFVKKSASIESRYLIKAVLTNFDSLASHRIDEMSTMPIFIKSRNSEDYFEINLAAIAFEAKATNAKTSSKELADYLADKFHKHTLTDEQNAENAKKGAVKK